MLKAIVPGFLLTSLVHGAKYQEYILASGSRELHPVSVYQVNGTVQHASSLTGDSAGSVIFEGIASVTYDFGKNIAGLVTLQVGDVDRNQYIGVSFTESSLWISGEGCDATADDGIDEALWWFATGPGNYTVSREHERGGFRYLSVLHNTTGGLELERITVHFTPMPHWGDNQLDQYTGYFHCDDELLNRVWYAGAYTNQMCTIDPRHGNSLVHLREELGPDPPPQTWYNNYTIANGSSVLVDGAKRDRLVWPGDMAIAVPSIFVSYNDLPTIANSLDSLFARQLPNGTLPYAGFPFPMVYSATYHLYNLIGVADYYVYSGDLDYVRNKWDAWKRGLNFSLGFIDESGLMNVTSPNDWLRFGMGGHNIEANSILYYTTYKGVMLGQVLGEDQSLLDSWQKAAEGVKAAANSRLWNAETGLYVDNETTILSPQDGNSWAIVANLTDSTEKNSQISQALASRWTEYGAPSPEAADAVSPFISGFEIQAHAVAGNATAALDLIKLEWGYMLDYKYMTNSTFIEGYLADGSLHYPPYTNDPRISHAHGWATGPTSLLSMYIAGLQPTSAGGATWELKPQVGDLKYVDAGYHTKFGEYSVTINATDNGQLSCIRLSTPPGTVGSINLAGVGSGSLVNTNGTVVTLNNKGVATHVPGGSWSLAGNGTRGDECSNATYRGGGRNGNGTPSPPPAYTGAGTSTTFTTSLLLILLVTLIKSAF
ncbi:glycoside hydrolase family 78 protein [Polychaeton citri CBS 116435]|uniref:Glycoside hydrolase family 78 protein n=1 Tax=Polychaeton citri CBS 116435 TaxID=1314669 RepID=A0A9P4UTN5_9PEZI|nr:glycoside hydrolase family 78 protein [Polychaeton citri CBS 116435]